MNEYQPYELIVAEKLQQLPVPDMADAIWARIERQLDIDMPTDDGGSSPTSPPGNGWMGGALVGVFVAALIVIFVLFQKEKPTIPQAQPEQDVPATQLPTEAQNDTVRSVLPDAQTRPPVQSTIPAPDVDAPQVEIRDSASVNLPPVQQDTVPSVRNVTPPPPQPPVQDTLKPRRGVSGISDSSYRIVPR